MFNRKKTKTPDKETIHDYKPLGLVATPAPTEAEKVQVDAYLKARVFVDLQMYFQQNNVRMFTDEASGRNKLTTPYIKAFLCGEEIGIVAHINDTGSDLEPIYFQSVTHNNKLIGCLEPVLNTEGNFEYVARTIEGSPVDFSQVTGLELDGFAKNLTLYLMQAPKQTQAPNPNNIPGDEYEIPVDLHRAEVNELNVPGFQASMYRIGSERGVLLRRLPEEVKEVEAEVVTTPEVNTTNPETIESPAATTPESNIPSTDLTVSR